MCLLRSRLEAVKYSRQDPAHSTVVLVRVLLLFESAMYSAITPVLPHYAHTLGASKPAVGVLAGAYPAGIIPASLIGAWIASRTGVRRTTVIGLLLFAVSIAGFGFATSIVALDALRFIQGAGCGFIWGGGGLGHTPSPRASDAARCSARSSAPPSSERWSAQCWGSSR